jgi:hypothetical protein
MSTAARPNSKQGKNRHGVFALYRSATRYVHLPLGVVRHETASSDLLAFPDKIDLKGSSIRTYVRRTRGR